MTGRALYETWLRWPEIVADQQANGPHPQWDALGEAAQERWRRMAEAEAGWRTMDAPRDGTAIIAWFPHLGRPVIAWFREQPRKGQLGPGWIVSHHTSHKSLMHGGAEPRCWMPVPAIPEWAR